MPMTKAKTKPIIAVDVDDVLTYTNEAIRQHVNKHFGTNFTTEDHTVPGDYIGYFERIWNVSHEEAEHRYQSFIHDGGLAGLEPQEGAIDVLKYLEKDYDLVVLSARHEDQVEMTHKWLLKHFPSVFKDVRFVSGWYHGRKVSKAEICKEIGAKYLIDDHIGHLQGVNEVGTKPLLFGEYGWSKENPQADQFTRVKDWKEVKKFFDEQPV